MTSRVETTLKELSALLGLDVSHEWADKSKIHMTVISNTQGHNLCRETIIFRSNDPQRSVYAAENFELLLSHMGARDIEGQAGTVSFRHFSQMPEVNTHLAKLVGYLQSANEKENMAEYDIESPQMTYNICKLIVASAIPEPFVARTLATGPNGLART